MAQENKIVKKVRNRSYKDNTNSINSEIKKTQKPTRNISLERVIRLTQMMIKDTEEGLSIINNINKKTEFLAINGLIEARRLEDTNRGFQVVAESIDVLAKKTKEAVETMRKETISEMENLVRLIQTQSYNIKGNRLSDLALSTIDIIDRNLYERAADVRWWATDETLVKSLKESTEEMKTKVKTRLKTILKSYTVYYDLILCDLNGFVIANGKSDIFNIVGKCFSDRIWFQSALATKNGEKFGFQTVHKSRKSGDSTLTFSSLVHENGDTSRKPIGVLAAVFDWMGLAQKIITDADISEHEKKSTRICLVDDSGKILADTKDKVYGQINFPQMNELFKQQKGFRIVEQGKTRNLVAHGFSPGYENYSSGWHCLIFNELNSFNG